MSHPEETIAVIREYLTGVGQVPELSTTVG
jgi:hypothetical protein